MRAMILLVLLMVLTGSAQAGTLLLRWNVLPASIQDGFQVFRNRPSRNATYRQIGTTTERSYRDATAQDGRYYCYRVRAVNAAGVSAFSNTACGMATRGRTTRLDIH